MESLWMMLGGVVLFLFGITLLGEYLRELEGGPAAAPGHGWSMAGIPAGFFGHSGGAVFLRRDGYDRIAGRCRDSDAWADYSGDDWK